MFRGLLYKRHSANKCSEWLKIYICMKRGLSAATLGLNTFLICFPMDYRDFSVISKVIISLFQTVRLSLSIFTACKFVLSPIKYD